MKFTLAIILVSILFCSSCTDEPIVNSNGILGYELLTDLSGHWVGSNETAYGTYDWFSFDFRPISPSHLHSIYEGGTNVNIITSIFIADFNGQQRIMARNGGWLGPQYRATYFVLDKAQLDGGEKFYRLVDAVGGEDRSYMEFRFENGVMKFDAYKDNSGTLDQPIHHMGFEGTNLNPSFAQVATDLFDFPQEVSEVNLEGQFDNLIDPDSALFLEEQEDPFPKADHGYLSELELNIGRSAAIEDKKLLLFISKESLVDSEGLVNQLNINTKVVRTIDVNSNETSYRSTYLHPDTYYVTAFYDANEDSTISSGDISSISIQVLVDPESEVVTSINVDLEIQ